MKIKHFSSRFIAQSKNVTSPLERGCRQQHFTVSFQQGCIFFLLLIISSCHFGSNKPDVSKINVKLRVLRFEQDLHQLDSAHYQQQLDVLNERYPDFLPFYLKAVAKVLNPTDTSVNRDSILHYLHDSYIRVIYDSTEKKYANFSDIEKQLTDAFKYYRYYFPGLHIPDIVTYIDGPPYCLTFEDEVLGIGLDGYLGEKFPAYTMQAEPVPMFALRKFRREYIVPNAINVLATGTFYFDLNGHNLIDAMIYKGKVDYFVKKLLPDSPDSLVFGYKDSTLAWLNSNEAEVWKFFIKNKLLYETDPLVYSKYINDGPNTSGMPPQAPGNIGSWVGYRIVEEYMKRNSNVTLEQLMKGTDNQKILQDSKYKP